MSERVIKNVISQSRGDDREEVIKLPLSRMFPPEEFTDLKYRLVHFRKISPDSEHYTDIMSFLEIVDIVPETQTIYNMVNLWNRTWISGDGKNFDREYKNISEQTDIKEITILVPPGCKECVVEFSGEKISPDL